MMSLNWTPCPKPGVRRIIRHHGSHSDVTTSLLESVSPARSQDGPRTSFLPSDSAAPFPGVSISQSNTSDNQQIFWSKRNLTPRRRGSLKTEKRLGEIQPWNTGTERVTAKQGCAGILGGLGPAHEDPLVYNHGLNHVIENALSICPEKQM